VGLFISKLKFFKCDSFVVYFHLWSNGGANWQKEFQEYQLEENVSWQTVPHKRPSYEALHHFTAVLDSLAGGFCDGGYSMCLELMEKEMLDQR
jgi:hypothetical protein